MISCYQIKEINNEEILYLYLDLNYEFGSLKNGKRQSVKESVKDFIIKNKIAFKGTTIALIVGGIMVGSYYLKEEPKENKPLEDIEIVEKKIDVKETKEEKKEPKEEITSNDRKEENIKEESNESVNKEKVSEKTKQNTHQEPPSTSTNNSHNTNTSAQTTSVDIPQETVEKASKISNPIHRPWDAYSKKKIASLKST